MSQKRTRRKKFVSAVVLITSVYTSILFAFGIIAGYLGARYFYNKYVRNGSLKYIYINFRSWKFHLHHWIVGVLVIVFLLLGGWKSEMPKFFWGIIGGVIAHDIYDFNDWHKVLAKKKKMI